MMGQPFYLWKNKWNFLLDGSHVAGKYLGKHLYIAEVGPEETVLDRAWEVPHIIQCKQEADNTLPL